MNYAGGTGSALPWGKRSWRIVEPLILKEKELFSGLAWEPSGIHDVGSDELAAATRRNQGRDAGPAARRCPAL